MPRDLEAAPAMEYLTELAEHNDHFWGGKQRSVDDLLIQMVFDEHPVQAPNTANKKRRRRIQPERFSTDEARREVELIVSLYPHLATVGVKYSGDGTKPAGVVDKVERGLNELLQQLNPPTDSPRQREVWQMVVLGRTARLIVGGHQYYWDFPFKPDAMSEDEWQTQFREWRRKAPLSLLWLDLPARSTFPPSFGALDDEALSILEVSGAELAEVFSADELRAANLSDYESWKTYKLSIHSNRAWLTYAIIGEAQAPTGARGVVHRLTGQGVKPSVLRQIEHGLGRSAIRILSGPTTAIKEPGYYWRSSISVRTILTADKLMTWAGTASKFDVFPILKSWLHEDLQAEGAAGDAQQYQEGDIIPLKPEDGSGQGREDIQPLIQPRFGEKTGALAELFLTRSERMSGAVEALEGILAPTAPAWSVNFSSEQARRRLSQLTNGLAQADLDAAEMAIRAIRSFGERVPLSDAEGTQMVLDPEELASYEASLKVEFAPKLPQNRRADFDMGLKLAIESKAAGIPISWDWIAETLMGIEQPFDEFKRAVSWWNLTSPPVMDAMNRHWLEEAEIELGGDEGLSVREFIDRYLNIPPDIKSALVQRATNGAGGASVNPQTRGAIRAGAPFSSRPGGPQPTEEVV